MLVDIMAEATIQPRVAPHRNFGSLTPFNGTSSSGGMWSSYQGIYNDELPNSLSLPDKDL